MVSTGCTDPIVSYVVDWYWIPKTTGVPEAMPAGGIGTWSLFTHTGGNTSLEFEVKWKDSTLCDTDEPVLMVMNGYDATGTKRADWYLILRTD